MHAESFPLSYSSSLHTVIHAQLGNRDIARNNTRRLRRILLLSSGRLMTVETP